jgi:ATP-dependent DNA helicase RecQ
MALLGYFGETTEPCGNCDICLDPKATLDGTADGKLILSVIGATGERYGRRIIDILKGWPPKVVAARRSAERVREGTRQDQAGLAC